MSIALDERSINSILKRFNVAKQENKDTAVESITKTTLTSFSKSLTTIQNAFSQVKTYSGNIVKIQKANDISNVHSNKGRLLSQHAQQGAALNQSSGDPRADFLQQALPQVTESLKQLSKNVEALNLEGQSGGMPDASALELIGGKSSKRGGMMRGMGLAGKAVGVAAIGMDVVGRMSEGQSAGNIAAGVGGGAVGGWAGAEAGAAIGTAILPGIGTAAGGLIGGALGYMGGSAVGDTAYKAVAGKKDKTLESAVSKIATPTSKPSATENEPKRGKTWSDRLSSFIGGTVNNVTKFIASLPAMMQSMGSSAVGMINEGIGAIQQGAENLVGSTGSTAAEFIARFEGFSAKAYHLGTEKYYTIGFGHQIQEKDLRSRQIGNSGAQVSGPRGEFSTITRGQAISLLQEDLPKYEEPVRKALGGAYGRLNDAQKAAFLSYSYNAGGGGVAKFIRNNNIAQLIQQNNMPAVAQAFKERGVRTGSGKVLPGLVKRRNAEGDLILKGFSGGIVSTAANKVSGAVSGAYSAGKQAVSNFTDNVKAVAGSFMNYMNFSQSVNFTGLKDPVKRRFTAMAAEFKQKTGRKITVNSALRTRQEQEALYRKFGPRRAAPPGRSLHESGIAIDVNSVDGNFLAQSGLLQKYGFHRPYNPKEPWHLEPIEGARLKAQPDNPYNPGQPIAQRQKGKTVVQNAQGQTKPVNTPQRQVGPVAQSVAIQRKVGDKTQITVVNPRPVKGGGGPSPMQYLGAAPKAKQPSNQNVNTAHHYKAYFNAA